MIDVSAAIRPHRLGLLMMRDISCTGQFGHAKQFVINAFDTKYLMSADEMMPASSTRVKTWKKSSREHICQAPSIYAFIAAGRGSRGERGHPGHGGRGGLGLPNKCGACGSPDHIMSSCMASDEVVFKWNVARRKMIIHRYGSLGGTASTHIVLMSDVPLDDSLVHASLDMSTLEGCIDEHDDIEVSVPFTYVAFSSSLTPSCDLSKSWIVYSACSINLTAFRGDFVSLELPWGSSRIGYVGVDVMGSGTIHIAILLLSSTIIRRNVHVLYTLDLSSRYAQRIGRLLSGSWMNSHPGCKFISPTDSVVGLLEVPTGMGVLKPAGNDLYLLSHNTLPEGLPPVDSLG
jgi:hypothetical protein